MPTQAFYNLESNKQRQLLESARKEFSQCLFENASINKIIKDINMPRGSFYLYFENKEDIYLYTLENYMKNIKRVLFEILNENNHDIFESIICFFDYIVNSKSLDYNLATNIFINMNSKRLEFTIPELLKQESNGYIMQSIDFSKYLIEEEEKKVLMSILFPLTFASAGRVLSKNCCIKEIREFYIKQINIIKRGLERK